MRTSRFSTEQMVGIVKEHAAGNGTTVLWQPWHQIGHAARSWRTRSGGDCRSHTTDSTCACYTLQGVTKVRTGVDMDDFVSMQQAADLMGVSYWTVYRLVKAGKLPTYRSPLNRRVKLVKRSDLAALMTPTPIEPEEGKAAA
jgi:excisionase family DNA binding protein